MSSPNINNIILIGCILSYSHIFVETIDTRKRPYMCEVAVKIKLCFLLYVHICKVYECVWVYINIFNVKNNKINKSKILGEGV